MLDRKDNTWYYIKVAVRCKTSTRQISKKQNNNEKAQTRNSAEPWKLNSIFQPWSSKSHWKMTRENSKNNEWKFIRCESINLKTVKMEKNKLTIILNQYIWT